MKSYRRILVPIFSNGQSDSLLHALQDAVDTRQAQVRVVRLIEPSSFADTDGPAAAFLPEETAARRAPAVTRQLELQLSRMNLGWVEAQVIWRQPREKLNEIIHAWQPDLVIASRRHPPVDVPADVDVLTTSGRGFLHRLTDIFFPPIPTHA